MFILAKIRNWTWFLFHFYDVIRHKYHYRKATISYLRCMDATRKLEWAAKLYGKEKE